MTRGNRSADGHASRAAAKNGEPAVTAWCEHVRDGHHRAPPGSLRRGGSTICLSRAPCYAGRRRHHQPEPDRRHQAPGRPPRGYRVTQHGPTSAEGPMMDGMTERLTTAKAAAGYHQIPWGWRRRDPRQMRCNKGERLLRQGPGCGPPRTRRRHPRRRARHRRITAPHPLWHTAMTDGARAGEDRFVSRPALIAEGDRRRIAYPMGLQGQAPDVVRPLPHAGISRQSAWPRPPVLRPDNGPPWIAEACETAGPPRVGHMPACPWPRRLNTP
jgi:hypothetical protein